jgi:hypothetical protein
MVNKKTPHSNMKKNPDSAVKPYPKPTNKKPQRGSYTKAELQVENTKLKHKVSKLEIKLVNFEKRAVKAEVKAIELRRVILELQGQVEVFSQIKNGPGLNIDDFRNK